MPASTTTSRSCGWRSPKPAGASDGPVALLGDSLGGIMTWYLLTREAGVDAAVCHDVSHPDESHDSSMRYKAPLMRALGRLVPGAPVPVRRIADYEHVALDPVTKAYFEDEIDKLFNFKITARAAASYLAFEPQTPWEEVRIPVLVVVGAEDRMVTPAFTKRCLARAKPPTTTYLESPAPATSSSSTISASRSGR